MAPRQTRRSRGTPRTSIRATRSTRTSTPTPQVDEDEQSQNASEEEPAPEGDGENEEAPSQGQDADDAEEADEASEAASEKPQIPPRRRPGRPPKIRPTGWGTPEPGAEDISESGTPARRGRGRGRPGGWRGGFRGRARRSGVGPAYTSRLPVDDDGNTLEVENDEVVLPEHPEGEKKVDKDGHLSSGREYRVRTFTIRGRENRLYMLSTEPARCTGFRDSYLFFTRHKHLYKIIIDDEEKKDLIERDILPHSYKGRAIGVVTARSVFREFGSRIVVGGKKIIDDYNTDEARARGDVEGELADPFDRLPEKGQEYNRNQYVAWHGASAVYHSNAPSAPLPTGALAGRRKGAITSANWMFEHAREAARFNSSLAAARRQTLDGVYDPHTNLMCYPRIMQPTRAVWEQVESIAEQRPTKKRRLNAVNGESEVLTNGIYEQADSDTRHLPQAQDPDGLPKPTPSLSRNYLIIDTVLYTAPHASLPPPDSRSQRPQNAGADESDNVGYDFDTIADAGLWRQGLPQLSNDDLVEFPSVARTAYKRAREMEDLWQDVWSAQSARFRPKIGISSMAG